MTLARERKNALVNTRNFLRSLLDPKQTPKVPKSIRIAAYWCLRHYPSDMYIDENGSLNHLHYEQDKRESEMFGEIVQQTLKKSSKRKK